MKIIRFKRKAFKPRAIDGNLALKELPSEPVLKTYQKPKVRRLVLKPQVKKNTRIFMGCYQMSCPANDGDGC
jgi:hypothetical protein